MLTPFVLILAMQIHESGRAPVGAGQTLAHAVQSPQVRPFVEWTDLPPRVVAGRTMTAANILEVFEVAPVEFKRAPPDGMLEALAQAIHTAERAAVDAGFVLVRLNRPWVEFADLPEAARAGRMRQAEHLLQRFTFKLREITPPA